MHQQNRTSQLPENKNESRLQHIRDKFFYYALLFPAVTFVTIFFFVVLVNLLSYSVTLYSGSIPVGQGLQNYLTVFQDSVFQSALLRTLIFALVVTPLELITGLWTASMINRSFKGRGIVRGIFIMPLALPVMVTASAFYILFSSNGHINALLQGQYSFFPALTSQPISFIGSSIPSFILVTIVKVWRDTPAAMLILLAGMQSVDQSQYEAARTMGCNRRQQLMYVTIPLLLPSISSVLVLRSIEAWKEFVFPYILSPSYSLMSMVIDKYFNLDQNPGMAAVAGIVVIICILAFSQLMKLITRTINQFLVKV